MNINNVKRSQKRFESTYQSNIGIQTYGKDNLYPQRMYDLIRSSTNGGTCLERYLTFPGNRDFIERLSGMPLAVQINAESLTDWRQRGKLIRMFKNGKAHLLGSDCHSLNRRPPNLGEGREVLRKRLGEDFLERMDRFGEGMLKE